MLTVAITNMFDILENAETEILRANKFIEEKIVLIYISLLSIAIEAVL